MPPKNKITTINEVHPIGISVEGDTTGSARLSNAEVLGLPLQSSNLPLRVRLTSKIARIQTVTAGTVCVPGDEVRV